MLHVGSVSCLPLLATRPLSHHRGGLGQWPSVLWRSTTPTRRWVARRPRCFASELGEGGGMLGSCRALASLQTKLTAHQICHGIVREMYIQWPPSRPQIRSLRHILFLTDARVMPTRPGTPRARPEHARTECPKLPQEVDCCSVSCKA